MCIRDSGWRGQIANTYTFNNLTRVSLGVALDLKSKYEGQNRNTIAISYDKRFLSLDFAKCSAAVFAKEGFKVKLTQEACPTPVLSWCAKNLEDMVGAVVITASHNPPTWNGFKFKDIEGCSASKATTDRFEKKIDTLEAQTLSLIHI